MQHIESQKNLEAETDKLKKTVDRLEAEKVKAEEAKRE